MFSVIKLYSLHPRDIVFDMTDAPNTPKDDKDVASLDEEKEGGSKKSLIILVVFIFLTAVGGGLYFSGLLDGLLGKDSPEEAPKEKSAHTAEATNVAFLAIPDMIVNLNSEGGKQRYLRLSVQLELESPEDAAAVEAILPRIIDQFQTYLRELRISDLRGSKGIYRLQIELLNRVNTAAAPVKVRDVLFQEILIQ